MLDRSDTIRARKVLHATNHAQLWPKVEVRVRHPTQLSQRLLELS
jgi:hypothetical protein